MPEIRIDPAGIGQARDVAAQQGEELQRIREYLKEHTELSVGSFGLLLMLAQPLTELVASIALTALKTGESLVAARVEALDAYLTEQAELEQAQVHALGELLGAVEQAAGGQGESAPDPAAGAFAVAPRGPLGQEGWS